MPTHASAVASNATVRKVAVAPTPGRSGRSSRAWGPSPAVASGIQQLMDMGFTESVAKEALKNNMWDVNGALDFLISSGSLPCTEEPPDSTKAGDTMDTASVTEASGDCIEVSTTASTTSSPRSHMISPPIRTEEVESPVSSAKSSSSSRADESEVVTSDAAAEAAADAAPSDVELAAEAEVNSLPVVVAQVAQDFPRRLDAVAHEAPKPAADADVAQVVASASSNAAASFVSEEEELGEKAEEALEEHSAKEVVSEKPIVKKRVERVETAWEAEDSEASGMVLAAVLEGDFILVWDDSQTENGWVYGEELGGARQGWLPCFVLQTRGASQRWMPCLKSCQAVHETQIDVKEGSMLLVTSDWRTDEGWVYAEKTALAAGSSEGPRAGWLPMVCIEWREEE